MNFAIWSIKNPIPPLLLFTLLTFAGVYGFGKFTIQDLPDITLPVVEVSLSLPGSTPLQLESEVARKVENTLTNVSGVRHITTAITDGQLRLGISFALEKNIADALTETKDAVERIRAELPSNLEAPSVAAVRINGSPLMTYAVASSTLDEDALSWLVDDTLAKHFMGIKGVGQFRRIGGVNREVRITVDPVTLAALNITVADVSRTLKQVQLETSSGHGYLGSAEQAIRTIATVATVSELAALPIVLAGGRYIRLDQVARVEDTHAKRTEAVLLNGEQRIAFQIYGSKGANEVQIATDVTQIVEHLRQQHPDLTLTPIVNTVTYTIEQYQGSMQMLYEGAILAVIVVGLFLRDWRATLISAIALPLSIIPTFGIMYWLGFSLNTLTLLALAVVVGILIDDAIVEIENIVRHKRMGKTRLRATQDAVNEIALAVIATTLTIAVVFLPTSLMDGVIGLLFRQFGWTVVVSVLLSLLVARLLTPLLAAYFLKDDHRPPEQDGIIMKTYLATVRWCLTHSKTTLFIATVFFALSIFLASKLPAGFIPPTDQGYTNLSLELPVGSTLEETLSTAEAVRKAVMNIQGIDKVFTVLGTSSEDSAGDVRKGSLLLTFLPKDQRPPQSVIDREIRQSLLGIAGAKFALKNDGPGETFALLLSSDNPAVLARSAAALEQELRRLPSLSNVSSTASLQRTEMTIRPDFVRAAELGVTTETIADTVRIATAGDFDPYLAKLNLDNRQLYIRVSMAESHLQGLDAIAHLRIPTHSGQTVLSNIAQVTTGIGLAQIDRYDRQRYVTLSADLGGAPLGQALEEAMALPAIKNLPSSVKLIEMGETEIMDELFAGFGIAMLSGVLCVFFVMVLLFKDFFQPITILSALPLSFGGSIIALLLMHLQLSLPALIGIIMLMGIVAKNSILLVEYTLVGMQQQGLECVDALLNACHKRARPIVMTTIAMIAGMTPIALGLGGDASFRQPMAVAVIGGLISSTLLSLLIVPVAFTYINKTKIWFAQQLRKLHLTPENQVE